MPTSETEKRTWFKEAGMGEKIDDGGGESEGEKKKSRKNRQCDEEGKRDQLSKRLGGLLRALGKVEEGRQSR